MNARSSRLQLDMDERRQRITDIARSMFLEIASVLYKVSDDLDSFPEEVRLDLTAHDPGGVEWLSTVQSTSRLLGQRIQNSFERDELNPGEAEIRKRVGELSPLENELFNSILVRELARRKQLKGIVEMPVVSQSGPDFRFASTVARAKMANDVMMETTQRATEQLARESRRSSYLRSRQSEFDEISSLARQLGEVQPTLETMSMQLARIRGASNQKGPLLFLLSLLSIGVIYPLVLLALNPVPSGSAYRFSSIAALLIVFLGEGVYLWRALGRSVE